jgi:hypothetical protein
MFALLTGLGSANWLGGLFDARLVKDPICKDHELTTPAFRRYGFNHHVWDNTDATIVMSRKVARSMMFSPF